jgi:ribonuclease HII
LIYYYLTIHSLTIHSLTIHSLTIHILTIQYKMADTIIIKKKKNVIKRQQTTSTQVAVGIQRCFSKTDASIEIGVDEAGRGPMLGRVYTAAVILPKDDATFDYALMKDSKKFHSVKKIREAAAYVKSKALYWHVAYADERVIEDINIRNATHRAMHEAVKEVMARCNQAQEAPLYHLLVDGNDFRPLMVVNADLELFQIPHTCIEGGDNIYAAIAAASILAKVARDQYIEDLCKAEPLLDERYGLLANKGYGTKIHMDGIKKYGISPYHRKTFGICKSMSEV